MCQCSRYGHATDVQRKRENSQGQSWVFNHKCSPDPSGHTRIKPGWKTPSESNGSKLFFFKHLGPQRPQVLFMDQHHSHEAEDLLDLARQENITLFGIPPHTSNYLQPLDRGCFSSLTKGFNRECSEYMSENVFHFVNKASFAGLFCKARGQAMTPFNIRSGFAVW